jgi:hypothetical protein
MTSAAMVAAPDAKGAREGGYGGSSSGGGWRRRLQERPRAVSTVEIPSRGGASDLHLLWNTVAIYVGECESSTWRCVAKVTSSSIRGGYGAGCPLTINGAGLLRHGRAEAKRCRALNQNKFGLAWPCAWESQVVIKDSSRVKIVVSLKPVLIDLALMTYSKRLCR